MIIPLESSVRAALKSALTATLTAELAGGGAAHRANVIRRISAAGGVLNSSSVGSFLNGHATYPGVATDSAKAVIDVAKGLVRGLEHDVAQVIKEVLAEIDA